jgi:beta-glucanase (GH16 family)
MKTINIYLLIVLSLSLWGCTPVALNSEMTVAEETPPTPTLTVTPDPNSWELVWADEFDQPDGSPPNSQKWNYQQGGAGWGNGELQHYTNAKENAFIKDGMLLIRANKEYLMGRDYTSARLTTQFKGDWTLGRVEIRAKLPNTQGIWPAFWMLPTRARYGGGAVGGEIDIMEMVGSEPSRVYGTLHFGNPAEHSSGSYDLPHGKTFSDDFHIFTMEWEPTEIRWYVDDILFHAETEWFTTGRKDAKFPAPFDQDFYLLINVAVGGYWPGSPNETSVFPQTLYVDYVRVFQHPNK